MVQLKYTLDPAQPALSARRPTGVLLGHVNIGRKRIIDVGLAGKQAL
jgi:hypothetical protein